MNTKKSSRLTTLLTLWSHKNLLLAGLGTVSALLTAQADISLNFVYNAAIEQLNVSAVLDSESISSVTGSSTTYGNTNSDITLYNGLGIGNTYYDTGADYTTTTATSQLNASISANAWVSQGNLGFVIGVPSESDGYLVLNSGSLSIYSSLTSSEIIANDYTMGEWTYSNFSASLWNTVINCFGASSGDTITVGTSESVGDLAFTFAVPEPSEWCTLAGALGLLLIGARRVISKRTGHSNS